MKASGSEKLAPREDYLRIASCNQLWWDGVYKKLLRSFLFIDENILELFHWNGSLPILLDSNIAGIKTLSDPNKRVPPEVKKATFIVGSILRTDSDQLAHVRRTIETNRFEYCSVISVAPHYSYILQKHRWVDDATTSQIRGTPLFERLETELIEWMGNANYTVEVVSAPLFLATPLSDPFLLCPSFSNLSPSLSQKSFHTDWEQLPDELKESVQNFVGCWHNLMASLDAKEDCYCVGPLSSILATRLANFFPAKSRRKNARNHVSLIFVDRSVDLLEPIKCPTAPILDRMLFSLDKLPGHSTDRSVHIDHESGFPGSLFHASNIDSAANSLYHSCLNDSMQNSASHAVDILSAELGDRSLPVPKTGLPVMERLKEMIHTLREDEEVAMELGPLYEASCAIHQVASETLPQKQKHQRWGKLVKRARHSQFNLEKLQKLAESEKLSTEEVILCLTTMASSNPKHLSDTALESCVGWMSDIVLAEDQEDELPPHIRSKQEDNHDEMTSRQTVREIFARINNYMRLQGVLELGKSGNFLTGLLDQILDPSDPEIPDLVCKTTGLTDVLRSGLGLFTNVLGQRNRPTDAATIIIFVLGGISAGELSELLKIVKKNARQDTEDASTSGGEQREYLFKLLVIGDIAVGKTSVIKRYVHNFYSQHYRATIGVDFAMKVINWDANSVVRLQLWDIAGQERFGNMTRVYYKEAAGAIVVFDITRASTFDGVLKWKNDLDAKVRLTDGRPVPAVLLANKCDMEEVGGNIGHHDLDEFCQQHGFVGWYKTSAKENIGVSDAANLLVKHIIAIQEAGKYEVPVIVRDGDVRQLRNGVEEAKKANKKKGCC